LLFIERYLVLTGWTQIAKGKFDINIV